MARPGPYSMGQTLSVAAEGSSEVIPRIWRESLLAEQ